MKLNCGLTSYERAVERMRRTKEWAPWFAWYPVRIGREQCAWLETVERRLEWLESILEPWEWHYRSKP